MAIIAGSKYDSCQTQISCGMGLKFLFTVRRKPTNVSHKRGGRMHGFNKVNMDCQTIKNLRSALQ